LTVGTIAAVHAFAAISERRLVGLWLLATERVHGTFVSRHVAVAAGVGVTADGPAIVVARRRIARCHITGSHIARCLARLHRSVLASPGARVNSLGRLRGRWRDVNMRRPFRSRCAFATRCPRCAGRCFGFDLLAGLLSHRSLSAATAAVGVLAIRIVSGLCVGSAWTFPASATRGASTFVHAIIR
jgi:hypothetical protein